MSFKGFFNGSLKRRFGALQLIAGAILVVLVVQAVLIVQMATRGRESIEAFERSALTSKAAIEEIRRDVLAYQLAAKDFLFAGSGEEKEVQKAWVGELSESIAKALRMLESEGRHEALTAVTEGVAGAFAGYGEEVKEVVRLVEADLLVEAMEQLDGPVAQSREELDVAVEAASVVVNAMVTAALRATETTFAEMQRFFILLGVAATVVALGLIAVVSWFSFSIRAQLGRVAGLLSSGSGRLLGIADSLARTSVETSGAMASQAASLEEASSSTEEQSAATRNNAGSARKASVLTKELQKDVEHSLEFMKELAGAMERIANSGEETQKIINAINDIAFQTNILALNAAVEAARAGEAGAGFAVVADEVRNLAMRSAKAAASSSDLIEASSSDIAKGLDLASQTHRAFAEAFEKTRQITDHVGSIAEESQDQSAGIEELSRSLHQMSSMTQQGASNTEHTAESAKRLRKRAHEMRHHIDKLNAMLGNGTADRDEREGEADMVGAAEETIGGHFENGLSDAQQKEGGVVSWR